MCGSTPSCACAKSHPGICSVLKQSIVCNDSVCGQRRCWSDCAGAQADLVIQCPKTRFSIARPIFNQHLFWQNVASHIMVTNILNKIELSLLCLYIWHVFSLPNIPFVRAFLFSPQLVLTLHLLNTTCPVLANTADSDHLASLEANWSGSALFVFKYVNFYQNPDQVIWLAAN